jgi:hypothetical protein
MSGCAYDNKTAGILRRRWSILRARTATFALTMMTRHPRNSGRSRKAESGGQFTDRRFFV